MFSLFVGPLWWEILLFYCAMQEKRDTFQRNVVKVNFTRRHWSVTMSCCHKQVQFSMKSLLFYIHWLLKQSDKVLPFLMIFLLNIVSLSTYLLCSSLSLQQAQRNLLQKLQSTGRTWSRRRAGPWFGHRLFKYYIQLYTWIIQIWNHWSLIVTVDTKWHNMNSICKYSPVLIIVSEARDGQLLHMGDIVHSDVWATLSWVAQDTHRLCAGWVKGGTNSQPHGY